MSKGRAKRPAFFVGPRGDEAVLFRAVRSTMVGPLCARRITQGQPVSQTPEPKIDHWSPFDTIFGIAVVGTAAWMIYGAWPAIAHLYRPDVYAALVERAHDAGLFNKALWFLMLKAKLLIGLHCIAIAATLFLRNASKLLVSGFVAIGVLAFFLARMWRSYAECAGLGDSQPSCDIGGVSLVLAAMSALSCVSLIAFAISLSSARLKSR